MKQEIEELAMSNWEIVNKQIKDGVNPHAYRLGFLKGYSQAMEQPKWVDPNELLPKIGTMVLTYGIVNDEYRIVFYDGLELCFDFWQLLPTPPNQTK